MRLQTARPGGTHMELPVVPRRNRDIPRFGPSHSTAHRRRFVRPSIHSALRWMRRSRGQLRLKKGADNTSDMAIEGSCSPLC